MGLAPPVSPVASATAWVIARVESAPTEATWGRPARVVLVVEEALRGSPPPRLELTLGAPVGSGQSYFYLTRHLGPPPWPPDVEASVARQRAALDATPVHVPAAGARIAVGITQGQDGTWSIRATGEQWVPESRIPGLRAQLAGVQQPAVDPRARRARRGLALLVLSVVVVVAFVALGLHRAHPALMLILPLAVALGALGVYRITWPD